tara:strand:- start:30084 stop:30737 length:654 start_codon:yes stop_codon:yes gene_type:complete
MSQSIRKLLRESLMNEMSISNVSLQDFNVKEIVNSWLMSSTETPVTMFKYEMQGDYNLTPEEKESLMDMDEDDVVELDRFKKWVFYEVESKIENFIDDIQHYIDGDTITIWREMTVDDKWIQSLPREAKRLGMYWSYEQDAAEAHWGGAGKRIQLQTSINQSYVDWNQTILANIDPQIGEDEKEITLFKNTPIKIEKLMIDNGSVDVSGLRNKIFKA